MKKCKMCENELSKPWQDTYCSNKCKYSDGELNAKRARIDKNDTTKLLQCKLCQWKTKDILNLGGHAKKHLLVNHQISDTSYINHYSTIDKEIVGTWNCPECNWKSKDIKNISGWVTTHIKTHYSNVNDFYEKYPSLRSESVRFVVGELQSNNGIVCQICNKKLLIISNSHLKTHNITQESYKKKYGDVIICDSTKEKLIPLGGTKSHAFISKAENEVNDYITSLNIQTLQSYKKLGAEIDVFIPDKNVGIEFNGLYWHAEISGNKDKNYHLNKLQYYEDKGIHLIHIFEDEWNHKKDIVKSRLNHILKVYSSNKIYARQCIIKEINSKTKNEFLNLNHLQGTDKSKIFIGAYFNDILVSVLTFSNGRVALGNKNINNSTYELSRFASSINYSVTGIFSKLLSYFIKTYKPSKIYTYADRRYSNSSNNLYLNNGFKFVQKTKPNYYYMKKYDKRLHRYNFTKHRILELGGNVNYTEWENMQSLGYDRIWDCGSLKYEIIL